MFYVYVNLDLISVCESFSEVINIIDHDIFNSYGYFVDYLVKDDNFLTDLFLHHHAVHTGYLGDFQEYEVRLEVWYG